MIITLITIIHQIQTQHKYQTQITKLIQLTNKNKKALQMIATSTKSNQVNQSSSNQKNIPLNIMYHPILIHHMITNKKTNQTTVKPLQIIQIILLQLLNQKRKPI